MTYIRVSIFTALFFLIGCGDSRDSFQSDVIEHPTFSKMTSGGYGFYSSAAIVYSARADKEGISISEEFINHRDNESYAHCLLHMMLVRNNVFLLDWLNQGNQPRDAEVELIRAWASINDDSEKSLLYQAELLGLLDG